MVCWSSARSAAKWFVDVQGIVKLRVWLLLIELFDEVKAQTH